MIKDFINIILLMVAIPVVMFITTVAIKIESPIILAVVLVVVIVMYGKTKIK